MEPDPEVTKLFHTRSTQMNMQFILHINIEMPTIVGILTFMSRINCNCVSEAEHLRVLKQEKS